MNDTALNDVDLFRVADIAFDICLLDGRSLLDRTLRDRRGTNIGPLIRDATHGWLSSFVAAFYQCYSLSI